MLELIVKRVQASTSYVADPLARHDAKEVEASLEHLVSMARPIYAAQSEPSINVNTASLTSSSRSPIPIESFENAGLPSENVLPGDLPGMPMLTGQSGSGTLDFLNDLSTSSLEVADWFAFFDS